MAYLYKRSNPLWHFLIRHRLTAAVWRPLLAWSRWRHLKFRRQLAMKDERIKSAATSVVSAGV